jgi:hypothetical protein
VVKAELHNQITDPVKLKGYFARRLAHQLPHIEINDAAVSANGRVLIAVIRGRIASEFLAQDAVQGLHLFRGQHAEPEDRSVLIVEQLEQPRRNRFGVDGERGCV